MTNIPSEVKVEWAMPAQTEIQCRAKKCINNMIWSGDAICNLKFVVISDDGKCKSFTTQEPKE